MRDYLLIFLILANVPIGLVQPYYGMLVYTWISLMYPHLFTWSFGRTFPVAKLMAVSVIAGTIIRAAGRSAVLRQRENVLMILLGCTFTISTIFAIYPANAWDRWLD